MPGSVHAMTPTAVFPDTLYRGFTESQVYTACVVEYHDGSSQRQALVSAPRHAWRLTKHLLPADLVTLRDFILLHIADTFYFYNGPETVPPYTSDPTGVATAGRYPVRVNSNWEQSMGIALADTTVELIEVTSMSSLVIRDCWITFILPRGELAVASDLCAPIKVLINDALGVFECEKAIATSDLGTSATLDVLYWNGSMWVSIFTSGLAVDGEVTSFAVTDLPEGALLRADCTAVDSAVADDQITIQIKGSIVVP